MAQKKSQLKHKIDAPPVTSDEALLLMCYHLNLAASYYEATDEDGDTNFLKMVKLMEPPGAMSFITGYIGPSLTAAKIWYKAIRQYYEELPDPLNENDPKSH